MRAVAAGWTLGALALLIPTAAPPAGAASPAADRPTVARSRLPTADEVARAFPYLSGGSRSLYRAEREDDGGNGPCFNWRTTLRAPTGRWASYATADGSVPFFQGRDDPTVFTYRYRSAPQARRAMGRLATWLRQCMGRHGDPGDVTWRITRHVPPSVGSRALGMSVRSVYPGQEGPITHRETQVVSQSGRYVTFAIVQAQDRMPKQARAVQLARISLTALR